MIANKVTMKSLSKSDYAGPVKYLTDNQSKNERIEYVSVFNCQNDWHIAIAEVLNTHFYPCIPLHRQADPQTPSR